MASTEFEPYLSVSPICEIGSLTTAPCSRCKVLTVKSRSETNFD